MTQPRTLRNFIGGEYVDATGDASIDLVNPATGQVVAHAPVSTQADVDAAYASAEAGFARDMQVHHGQAVEMAMDIYRTTENPDVRVLAYDIAADSRRTRLAAASGLSALAA